ncbi:immune inhibitor A domain-containing protein [Nonomuraea sp. NPDC050536]|uniref:immune inhibitor A domain-containing protein n=1 Tax=Nonomuraea sp. NPDC050536 TaxID=3364366 RepID=UPI0037CA4F7C
MRKFPALLACLALALVSLQGPAHADPATGSPPAKSGTAKPGDGHHPDEPYDPIAIAERADRTSAMQEVLAAPSLAQVKVGKRYVERSLERKDRDFAILAEFGDRIDNETQHNGQIRYGGTPGPQHNMIPRPDASYDNHTLWRRDFNQAYYQRSLFDDAAGANSLRNFYRLQSSGRYDLNGAVSDWVRLPYNEARYGTPRCDPGLDCDLPLFDFAKDAGNAWYQAERAKGRSREQIIAELKSFDVWDRNDYDHDGNFNEPDGYLDRVQIIHAGVDETWGGGAQGADALWGVNHDAYWNLRGTDGPEFNKQGGTQIGDTGIWIGKFLTVGENSGVGLLAHEFGHDLGLPDLYDTAGGDNGVKFWSLMSDASYLAERNGPLGEYPGDLDAWSKLRLGWLSYDRAQAATASTHTLGVSSYNTKDPQALLVSLPPHIEQTELTDPPQGQWQWWSGRGNYLNNTLTREIDLATATSTTLTAKTWFRIEQDFDYLYAEVSTDGKVWKGVGGTLAGRPIPSVNGVPGLTGHSDWADLAYDLSPWSGQKVLFRLRYFTDTNTVENGFVIDSIALPGVFSDDAEQGDNGWSVSGFSRTGKIGVKEHPRAYLVENRRYVGNGTYLKTGPYSAGFLNDPKRAQIYERFPYQDGVLVWLWDSLYSDNNTSQHLGEGMTLPIDARAIPLLWRDNTKANGRLQVFDAIFGLGRTDQLRLHKDGALTVFPAQPGVPAFDDHTGVYWYSTYPLLGVRPPDTNTRIEVVAEAERGLRTTVRVGPSTPLT